MAEQINITPMFTHAIVRSPVVDPKNTDRATAIIELGVPHGWRAPGGAVGGAELVEIDGVLRLRIPVHFIRKAQP